MSVWDELAGSRAVDVVKRQLGSGEVAHAWLLLGPRGSGKRAVALAMAAALNCPVEPGLGCGRCSTCRRISRRRHPDVHHVVPEGPLIPVDVVRESIVPEAARSPFEGARKVFIVEEADRMNQPAQNALLKTLEEPEPDTVFVLISEHEDELLETVRSRCLVTRLEPLAQDELIALLERQGASEDQARLAARLADGDLERARALAFDPAVAARRRLWTALPRRLASPVDALDAAGEVLDEARRAVKELEATQRAELDELEELLGDGRRGGAGLRQSLVKRYRREARRREQDVLSEALQALASFYRDVVAFRAGAAEAVANLDLVQQIEAWARSGPADGALLQVVERCIQAQAALPMNANASLTMESVLVEAARLAPPPERVVA